MLDLAVDYRLTRLLAIGRCIRELEWQVGFGLGREGPSLFNVLFIIGVGRGID